MERNRLFVLVKNFPGGDAAGARRSVSWRDTCGTLGFCCGARGSAARFRAEAMPVRKMAWYVVQAHAALLGHLRALLAAAARDPRARARITPAVFRHLLRSHAISARGWRSFDSRRNRPTRC